MRPFEQRSENASVSPLRLAVVFARANGIAVGKETWMMRGARRSAVRSTELICDEVPPSALLDVGVDLPLAN